MIYLLSNTCLLINIKLGLIVVFTFNARSLIFSIVVST
jgi:hypothetical protein